jgi:hypothetical protein
MALAPPIIIGVHGDLEFSHDLYDIFHLRGDVVVQR